MGNLSSHFKNNFCNVNEKLTIIIGLLKETIDNTNISLLNQKNNISFII